MPHFIIKSDNAVGNSIKITDKELYNHVIKVRRAAAGEMLLFVDENEIQYETVLKSVSSSSFECEILNRYKSSRKLPINLYAAQSVLNSDDQTSAVQKATECGVRGIIPLYTDNCAVKESIIRAKIEKWQKIALESVKQCERADIPKVSDCAKIDEIIDKFDYVVVFAEKYAQGNFFDYVKTHKPNPEDKILVVIGPEGGFSEREFEFFKSKNIPLITLGELIYRADTALTAALTTVINGVLYV